MKPSLAASIQTRTLQRLFELLGSRSKLARMLRVPEADLGRWLSREAKAPMPIFTRAVELLLDETEPPGGDEGHLPDPPAERDCASADPASRSY